jgi:WASH complex subunit strumpellin
MLSFMLRLLAAKDDLLVTLSVAGDFAYAWDVLSGYVEAMQDLIREEPSTVIQLRSLFLKVASVMDLPLLRINQSQSPDLISVSQFYSGRIIPYYLLSMGFL